MREGKHVIVSICYSVVIFNAVALDLLFTCKLSVFGTETFGMPDAFVGPTHYLKNGP